MNVAPGGEVHHGVRTPADGPDELVDLLRRRGGDRRVADVGIDLHQEVASDDHRLRFRVIDVRGDDGAPGCDLGAYELRSHVIRNAGAPGVTVPDSRCTHLAAEIFADGDVLHLRGDDAGTCVGKLCHAKAATGAQRCAAFGKLQRRFATGGETIVDRLDP